MYKITYFVISDQSGTKTHRIALERGFYGEWYVATEHNESRGWAQFGTTKRFHTEGKATSHVMRLIRIYSQSQQSTEIEVQSR